VSAENHRDVASYALGVLDERDTERFEEHLATCSECIVELESLLPVVDVLAEVDSRDFLLVERADPDDGLFDRVLSAVGEDRRRARRSRRLYTLAAAVVLVAMLTGLGLFVSTQGIGPEVPSAGPTTGTVGPSGSGTPGPGIGGPDLPAGERFSVTDRASGLSAELVVGSAPFGTRISFALSKLSGPRTCRLVVVPRNGPNEAVSSWTVPTPGYGTTAQPRPLNLQATTFMPRDEMKQLQVQEVKEDGSTSVLLTVPL